MTILFCGKFDPDYNRTRIIINGLRKKGVEVLIYNYPKKRKADKSILRELLDRADYVFLPSFTHTDLPFIKKQTDKAIIFDPLISRYLSKVFDYQTINKNSPRAYKNYLKDSRSLKNADLIISDTLAHKNYFVEKFGIDPEKIRVVHIGVMTEDFFPIKIKRKLSKKLSVGFYGSFIPLHGIDIILQAAKILENDQDIEFKLIGDGVLMSEMKALSEKLGLQNTEFTGLIPYQELNEEINKFDIALGIFGSSLKAKLVIPNKIFHYAACEKPVISMSSDAMREIFCHNKNIFLVENTAPELANAILKLKDPEIRKKISTDARKLVTDQYNDTKIAGKILDFIEERL